MAPRRPVRLLDKSNISSAYPKELVADFDSGDLILVNEDGSQKEIPGSLSIKSSGTGNAVTSVSVSEHTVTVEKGSTFLTAHPTISVSSNNTETASPDHGESFTAISGITKDSNGHVTKVTTKTVTLPTETELSIESSGTGNAVTGVDVSDHKITLTKGSTFLTAHPTISVSTNTTSTDDPGYGGTFTAIDSITKDSNGHVTKINTKTITMPSEQTIPDVEVTVSGSGNAVTAATVSGHSITLTKGSTFLTAHPTITTSTDTTSTASPAHAGTFTAIDSVTRDSNGHVTKVNTKTVTLPAAPTSVSGNAGTATKLATARTIAINGAVTGTATSFDGSKNISINTTAVDASKITGIINIDNIPRAALERLVPVEDEDARLALTSDDVQNGDVVKVEATGLMYYVVDDSKLGTEDAFEPFTAGTASAVPWSGIIGKPDVSIVGHTHNVTVTPSGSIGDASITPKGTVGNASVTPAGTVTSTFNGTAAEHNHTFKGTAATINASYTPAGTVDSTFNGTESNHTHSFTGTAANHNHSFSGSMSHTHTFTGTAGNATASYTPAGTVGSTFTGTAANHNHSFSGSMSHTHSFTGTAATINASYTPAGTVGSTFKGTAANHNHSFSGSMSHTHTFTGTAANHNHSFSGSMSHTHSFTGSAVTSGAANAGHTVYSITGVGSLPALTASISNQCLTLTFSKGSLPTRSSAMNVTLNTHTHKVTASGTVANTTVTISGTSGDTSVTPGGSIANTTVTISGTAGNASVTPAGTVTSTFNGTAGTTTASYTPAGSIANTTVTISGTAGNASVTPAGTVTSTFNGTAANINAAYTPAGSIANTTVSISGTSGNTSVTPAGSIANTALTPGGTVTSTFNGTAGTTTASYTPAGSIANTNITPAGTISSTFKGTAASHNHSFTGTAANHNHSFTGTANTVKSST